MKITQNTSGEQYHLTPGTELEIERTNPFFNDYGEQSLPVTLPDSDHNRILMNFPDMTATKNKITPIQCRIEDGDFVMPSRQVILSAKKKSGIECSFYLNEGAFYASMPTTKLMDIFAGETVSGISTVAQALAFCTGLLTTYDERFSIFPVLIDGDTAKKYINRFDWMDANGVPNRPYPLSDQIFVPAFYNSFQRTEVIDEVTITLPIGYYISPFIRANYLLKRVLAYFGYTLQESFFTTTDPFTKMVFINNTVDTIIKGVIKLTDVIPDITCSDLLDIFRKKFNCEFIPDELTKTVKIELFKATIESDPSADLTTCLVSEPNRSIPEAYKQIRLTSSDKVADTADAVEDFDDVPSLLKAYPTALLNRSDMSFYRRGFSCGSATLDKVASSCLPYQDVKTQEIEEITAPDTMPVMLPSLYLGASVPSGIRKGYSYVPIPYIGAGNSLNSKLVASSDSSSDNDTASTTETQKAILAFAYDATGYGAMLGTISSYNYLGTVKLWDYSLCYFGPEGLFEKFYRTRDDLLRNSLNTVTAEVLLTNTLKASLPAHKKVVLKGQQMLINSLRYRIGSKPDPRECEFLTLQLYEPVDQAAAESTRLAPPAYKWSVVSAYSSLTEAQYNASEYKDKTYAVVYPAHPTALGGQFHDQYVAKSLVVDRDTVYRLYHYYLTGVDNI